jgi:monoamine oxidase
MTHTEVAVVGGGLAGLNAARLLHAAGVDFLLLEARDRPGGRILTVGEDGRPAEDGFDLGASWLWPARQPALGALIAGLGLRSLGQHFDGDALFERAPREAPHRISGMRDDQSLRVAGGSAALIRALARGLPPDRLRFGAPVMEMRLAAAGVELRLRAANGREEVVAASQVVAALPPRILAATVGFEPATELATLRRWQGTPTWMAPHAKVFATYDRPFWREAGLSGTAQSLVGPLAEIHDATTHSSRAALFGFVGLGARQRAAIGEAALIRACLQQLTRLFGAEAAAPRATLCKDWAADPLTATPADEAAAGHPPSLRHGWVDGPWQARLTLAGSETSTSEAGYLAGAVEASSRAVAEVLGRIAADAAQSACPRS